ncbi:MOSC N-terminal beta barrel domain-containing protein, partial [Oleiphilus sp. HI0061]
MSEYKISALNIHPVKSLGPVSLSEVEIDRFGLRFDRRFMLVDDAGRFIT